MRWAVAACECRLGKRHALTANEKSLFLQPVSHLPSYTMSELKDIQSNVKPPEAMWLSRMPMLESACANFMICQSAAPI
ncbi:hypothetical protein ES702_00420 [subsurface metagenome]